MRPVTSPLKWVGGKRDMVATIAKYWLPYSLNRLVEPFVGGMSLSLGLGADNILANDTNYALINFYRWVKRGLEIDIDFVPTSDVYYKYRERFNDLINGPGRDTQEAALLFYYLNRTGYLKLLLCYCPLTGQDHLG